MSSIGQRHSPIWSLPDPGGCDNGAGGFGVVKRGESGLMFPKRRMMLEKWLEEGEPAGEEEGSSSPAGCTSSESQSQNISSGRGPSGSLRPSHRQLLIPCPKDISETRPSGSADSSQIQLTPLTVFFLPRKNKKKDKTMGSDSGVRVEGNLSADDATQGGRTHVTPVWWQELAPTRRSRCLAPRFPFPALGALPRLRQDAAPQAEPVPVMATAGPDLYERLQIRYPPSPPARAPAPAAHPAASGWALGTTLAVATGVLLVLGAALVALIVLHVQGQAELRAAQAELAAVGAPLLPDPDGSRGPAKSPAAVQRQKEQLGRWLQELALGWRYHDGQIYYFSGERKTWGEAEAACRSSHSHLASITSPEEQLLGAGAAGQHRPREVGAGGLRPDPPRGQRPLERPQLQLHLRLDLQEGPEPALTPPRPDLPPSPGGAPPAPPRCLSVPSSD
ncbi:uncharacterized protein LOC141959865 isoform X2 [Athene noctua]|uniref:uncharacterized protein LOC141959865 isoform X2 n=1 Tax=Athene noctua TaxID=126797 RepID=UPI003EC08EA5